MKILHGRLHAGIMRLVNISLREQTAVCRHVLQEHGDELSTGAIITVEQNRLRIRLPD